MDDCAIGEFQRLGLERGGARAGVVHLSCRSVLLRRVFRAVQQAERAPGETAAWAVSMAVPRKSAASGSHCGGEIFLQVEGNGGGTRENLWTDYDAANCGSALLGRV